MPTYDYECSRCGPFSDFRPIGDYALPAVCPTCSAEAPRALLSVPAMFVRGGGGAAAQDGPRASRFSATSGHGASCGSGCGCGNRLKIRREDWVRKLL